MARYTDMLHGSLWDKIILFAIPLGLTSMCENLFNSADVAILGHYVNDTAMAAAGSTVSGISLLVTWFINLSIGVNVTVANHLGAGDKEAASRAAHTGILFSLLFGLFMTVAARLTIVPLLNMLSVPEAVMAEAGDYFGIYLLSLPFISLYNFEAAIFRSRGDTRTPFVSLAICSVLNILLDLLAVNLFHLGISAVAAATVFAYFLNAVLLLCAMMKGSDEMALRFRRLRFDKKELAEILRIGAPAGLQGSVFCLANVVIQSGINSLGPAVMAASSAAFIPEILLYTIMNAFGQAATTFIGQNRGAGNLQRCRDVFRWCMLLDCVFPISVSALLCWQAPWLMTFFTSDAEVIHYGVQRYYYVISVEVIDAIIEVICGALRGYGNSLPPALISVFAICGVRVLWCKTAFVAMPYFHIVLLAYPISWVVCAVILGLYYHWFMKRVAF
ncbi:MAG: MATE family efflux transporter [Acidaminococcus sp.]|nr:MATE family efflux transporter [Acidaminococcus sp.]MCI2116744.1 MATE family efflux transporter [Acidaminococcus sp.]